MHVPLIALPLLAPPLFLQGMSQVLKKAVDSIAGRKAVPNPANYRNPVLAASVRLLKTGFGDRRPSTGKTQEDISFKASNTAAAGRMAIHKQVELLMKYTI